MKKTVYVLIGLVAIIVLVYLIIDMKKSSEVTPETSLIDFAIEDTAAVNKIVVYNSFNNKKYTVTRKKGEIWYGPNNECVQQSIPKMMLTTFKDVTLKGYVPKAAMKNMKRILMAQYKKVEIFVGSELVKTWYIGQATQDHLGTYMLLETPTSKSFNPVIMGMKGFYGILGPRFVADARKYECTNLFSFDRAEMKTINVINRVSPNESFEVDLSNPNNMLVHDKNGIIKNVSKDNLLFYLNGFKNIHFNQPNYTMTAKEIDSMKSRPADYEIQIEGLKSKYDLKMYRRPDPDAKQSADSISYDQTYLWGITKEGKVVRLQYYTVGPLLEGRTVFVQTDKSK